MPDTVDFAIENIQPFYKDGEIDYLFAKVNLNVRRDGHHELGDNIHVFVQLPPESLNLTFDKLHDLAAEEALKLLKAAASASNGGLGNHDKRRPDEG